MGNSSRIGEKKLNNFGSKMIILNYKTAIDIDIYFPEFNWIFKKATYDNFKMGRIKCPYEKRFYNKGYLGEGEYDTNHKSFKHWYRMLERCYDSKLHNQEPSYIKCECCESWLNFQNYAEWFENNYYEIGKEKMQLDKDILIKDNKIYSPETCIFVPQRINNLFTKRQNDRGELPIGVTKLRDEYLAQINKKNKRYRKLFTNIVDAFNWYKLEKEKYIKEVAEEYKDLIPKELYEAMYNYKVEIND